MQSFDFLVKNIDFYEILNPVEKTNRCIWIASIRLELMRKLWSFGVLKIWIFFLKKKNIFMKNLIFLWKILFWWKFRFFIEFWENFDSIEKYFFVNFCLKKRILILRENFWFFGDKCWFLWNSKPSLKPTGVYESRQFVYNKNNILTVKFSYVWCRTVGMFQIIPSFKKHKKKYLINSLHKMERSSPNSILIVYVMLVYISV